MYQVAKELTNPYFLLTAALGMVLIALWHRRRETKKWLMALTVPYMLLVVLSLPVVSGLALQSLENQYPLLEQRPDDAQAIVVLGGGLGASFFRCGLGAKLYHQGKTCPVVFSSDAEETAQMRQHLLKLGVREQDLVEEANSHNTYENGVNSSELLALRQIRKIVLVTDATHMPRAAACFRKQGLEVVAAGQPLSLLEASLSLGDFLPNPEAFGQSQYAAQEWLGKVWYWMKGRI